MKLGGMYLWGSARRRAAAGVQPTVEDEDEDTSPLLVSRNVPIEDTPDRQLRNYVMHAADYFNHWKHTSQEKQRSHTRTLQTQLAGMLPAFLGARDYAAAGRVLSILYQRFSVAPALCVQASLEILRRQGDMERDLVAFYRTAIEHRHLDKLMMMKELWTYYIVQGDFYEAYRMYHDEIQETDISDDHRLLANYGVLCYWLLIIESSEVREKLRKQEEENMDDENDEETADGYADTLPKVQAVESLIESKYAFKSPIGVHILYQGATNALCRAVGLSPDSVVFLEYYVQLLVLAGDIGTACDYLENYYRLNEADPHGARMLAGFLEKYYPDSGEEQASIYVRWMRNDPAALFPLERLIELYGAGSVSSNVIVEAIANSLDTCGGDLHLAQNPVVCVTLWRHFAETIVAMDEEELMRAYDDEGDDAGSLTKSQVSRDEFLANFGARRQWWKRVYFSKPTRLDDVARMTAEHPDLLDVWIYRAAVADRVFPEYSPSTEVLRQAVKLPVEAVQGSHMRLFKSFFGAKLDESADLPSTAERFSFPKIVTNIKRSSLTPVMTGDSITSRVLPRSVIVKDTQHAKRGVVKIAVDAEAVKIDEELSAELQRAVEGQSIRVEDDTLRTLATESMSTPVYKERRLTVPIYINLIEEATYCNPRMTTRHLFQSILEKLKGTHAIIPTLLEVETARRSFIVRWARNLLAYGNYGLLVRYEGFIMRHVLIELLHGRTDFPSSFTEELLIQMKRELPSSHMHFPNRELMGIVMPRLVKAALRLRRRKIFEVRNAMRGLCLRVIQITYDDLVAIAWDVCTENSLAIFLTRDQVCKMAYAIIGTHYKWVSRALEKEPDAALETSAVSQLTDPVERYFASDSSKMSYFRVYVMTWLDEFQRKRAEAGEVVDSDDERILGEPSKKDRERGLNMVRARREAKRAYAKNLRRLKAGEEVGGGRRYEDHHGGGENARGETEVAVNADRVNGESDRDDGYRAGDDDGDSDDDSDDDGEGSSGESTESDQTLPAKYRVAGVKRKST